MAVEAKILTYEDYLDFPETTQRYEILDGVFTMTPAPTPDHQWILGNLFVALRTFVQTQRLGVVLCAPLDIVIQRERVAYLRHIRAQFSYLWGAISPQRSPKEGS